CSRATCPIGRDQSGDKDSRWTGSAGVELGAPLIPKSSAKRWSMLRSGAGELGGGVGSWRGVLGTGGFATGGAASRSSSRGTRDASADREALMTCDAGGNAAHIGMGHSFGAASEDDEVIGAGGAFLDEDFWRVVRRNA